MSALPQISNAEWQTRCDLAAAYRMLHHLRMTDLIYTHLTARVPGEINTFLINNYGDLFEEITASSLVKMDLDGNVVGENNSYNEAGFTIHSGVYRARADVNCIVHTHTLAGIAVSMTREGLLPASQDSLVVYDDLGYHDYGTPASASECEALGRSCQKVNSIILRNHGLLTLGADIPAAFLRMYLLEHACAEQLAARSMSTELYPVAPDVVEDVRRRFSEFRAHDDFGMREWQAMLRMLERKGDHYRR